MAHNVITQMDKALDVLFTRLASALDPQKKDWNENESQNRMCIGTLLNAG